LQRRSKNLLEENTLKVDIDRHPGQQLEQEWVQQTLLTLRRHHERVDWIKATKTGHGRHYYIKIDPPVEAQTANRLQFLLCDDAKRVDFNQARIDSGLSHWNILFETVGRKLRTIYSNPALQSTRKRRAKKARQPDPFISDSGGSMR
jgi:hypothetical protein